MHEQIITFLGCPTPDPWIKAAEQNIELLLVDHAHCEKKAASTAISLISQYPHETQLLMPLSRLAREEMRHFESVLKILKNQNILFYDLPPGRYARGLHKYRRTSEKERLIDSLLIAALIEARSCERFYALQIILPPYLKDFYGRLYQAEARHFQTYFKLAFEIGGKEVFSDLEPLKKAENDLILEKDPEFRFHSGLPQ
jgi:tRNA-(ms[2]io[6]A)-hydroxylase